MTESTVNPLVSIIVRTKDRPKLLKRALQSIAAQTYRPIGVVIVNDGGRELDVEEIRGILGDVSMEYIRFEKNMGRARAGNVGIRNAKGEYVGFLDDDDELLPEHLTALVSFSRQSDYRVAYGDALFVYKDYDPDGHQMMDLKSELIFSQDFNFDRLIFENYIPFMCLLFEKGVLVETGGIDEELDLYEDWDLLIRIGTQYPFHHIRKVTAHYNQWSIDLQIAQRNRDPEFLKQSYLRILNKHFDKVTPEKIHTYMTANVHARGLLGEKDAGMDFLLSELKEREEELAEERDQVRDLEALVTAMRNTLGWRTLERYRRVRNRLFQSTSRDAESLVSRGLNVLRNQGFKAFMRKANKKLLFNKTIKQTPKMITSRASTVNSVDTVISGSPIESRVSVVIPTKNAGEEFDYVLRRITQQELLRDIEVVIVDSGSDDGTLEVSREYTDNILQIPPGEFHHARTRNLGAERATGEFLVFTVQDAVPIGNNWLYKLLLPICEGKAAAVSARQIPSSDADLFSCWSYWNHNLGYLGYGCDHIRNNSLFENFDDLDMQTKRTMASLDSVCLGIRKSTFTSYGFCPDYAEDLDLGVRLIKDGHSLLFQESNAVIHSHTRPPMYFLKRSYTDTVSLRDLLLIRSDTLPATSVLEAVSYVYSRLKMAIAVLAADGRIDVHTSEGVKALSDILDRKIDAFESSWRTIRGDELVDNYFARIEPIFHPAIVEELSGDIREMLDKFSVFMRNYAVTEDIEDDFLQSIFKIFCVAAGNYLGSHASGQIDSLKGGI